MSGDIAEPPGQIHAERRTLLLDAAERKSFGSAPETLNGG
jgi:hypothetical protein